MGRYDFQSVGGEAANAIEEFLIRREMTNRQRVLDEIAGKDREADRQFREREFALREGAARTATERQAKLDAQAEQDRQRQLSDASNARGMRLFTADAIRQPGVIDNRDTARALAADIYGETGQVPGIVARALEPPTRTVVTTPDAKGNPMRKAFTDEELIAGVPEYRAPVRAPQPPRTQLELPVPVQDYLQSLTVKIDPATGRRYTEQRAKDEIARHWSRLRQAHPELNTVRVQQALASLFRTPEDDSLFSDDEDFDGPEAATPEGGRTASVADVQAVAQRAGISEAEARQRLEASGVAIR